jgi:hypothetical protein
MGWDKLFWAVEGNFGNFFYILLTVHLDVILVSDQLDALFLMYLFYASTCCEQVPLDQHVRESPTRVCYTR